MYVSSEQSSADVQYLAKHEWRDFVESSSLEIFGNLQAQSWASGSRWPCLSRGIGQDGLQRSFQPQPFCDSVSEPLASVQAEMFMYVYTVRLKQTVVNVVRTT